jgi:hypothetical protein
MIDMFKPGILMTSHSLVLCVTFVFLAGSAAAIAQRGPRTDILTGEPIRPHGEHPRTEPEIFNAPHAPRQEQRRGEDLPLEIYVAPQIGNGVQQNQLAPGRSPQDRRTNGYESYPTRRSQRDRGWPGSQDRATIRP